MLRRKDVLRGDTGRALAAMPTDDRCRRCGMSQEEHAPLKGKLQVHHAVPISNGGHPTCPSNLFTLCYFCHREWHTFWEAETLVSGMALPIEWELSFPPLRGLLWKPYRLKKLWGYPSLRT